MNTINTTTAEYGHLTMGKGYAHLVNATSLSGAVTIWMKRVMKMRENSPVFKADSTVNFKATLQNWHNDYKSVVLYNAENDGQEGMTSVSLEETADHLINTFGFICENHKSVAPHRILPELMQLFNRWGIQE